VHRSPHAVSVNAAVVPIARTSGNFSGAIAWMTRLVSGETLSIFPPPGAAPGNIASQSPPARRSTFASGAIHVRMPSLVVRAAHTSVMLAGTSTSNCSARGVAVLTRVTGLGGWGCAASTLPAPVERTTAINNHAAFVAYGCPIGRLALEIDPSNDAAMDLIAKNFAGWTGAVETLFQQERDRFRADTDFAGLAQFVLTVMEGGVMQARARRDIAPFDASVAHLRRYIALLMA
jgi:Tetracyclin repressor-like, C-terminal domain